MCSGAGCRASRFPISTTPRARRRSSRCRSPSASPRFGRGSGESGSARPRMPPAARPRSAGARLGRRSHRAQAAPGRHVRQGHRGTVTVPAASAGVDGGQGSAACDGACYGLKTVGSYERLLVDFGSHANDGGALAHGWRGRDVGRTGCGSGPGHLDRMVDARADPVPADQPERDGFDRRSEGARRARSPTSAPTPSSSTWAASSRSIRRGCRSTTRARSCRRAATCSARCCARRTRAASA